MQALTKNCRLILSAICVVALWSCRSECNPPSRPTEVPNEATYVGGCDGGVWIWKSNLSNIDLNIDKMQLSVYEHGSTDEPNTIYFICSKCSHDLNYVSKNIYRIDWNYFDGQVLSYMYNGSNYTLERAAN